MTYYEDQRKLRWDAGEPFDAGIAAVRGLFSRKSETRVVEATDDVLDTLETSTTTLRSIPVGRNVEDKHVVKLNIATRNTVIIGDIEGNYVNSIMAGIARSADKAATLVVNDTFGSLNSWHAHIAGSSGNTVGSLRILSDLVSEVLWGITETPKHHIILFVPRIDMLMDTPVEDFLRNICSVDFISVVGTVSPTGNVDDTVRLLSATRINDSDDEINFIMASLKSDSARVLIGGTGTSVDVLPLPKVNPSTIAFNSKQEHDTKFLPTILLGEIKSDLMRREASTEIVEAVMSKNARANIANLQDTDASFFLSLCEDMDLAAAIDAHIGGGLETVLNVLYERVTPDVTAPVAVIAPVVVSVPEVEDEGVVLSEQDIDEFIKKTLDDGYWASFAQLTDEEKSLADRIFNEPVTYTEPEVKESEPVIEEPVVEEVVAPVKPKAVKRQPKVVVPVVADGALAPELQGRIDMLVAMGKTEEEARKIVGL